MYVRRLLLALLSFGAILVCAGCDANEEETVLTLTFFQREGQGYRELARYDVPADEFVDATRAFEISGSPGREVWFQPGMYLFTLSYCGDDPLRGTLTYFEQGGTRFSCREATLAPHVRLFGVAPWWDGEEARIRFGESVGAVGTTADSVRLDRSSLVMPGRPIQVRPEDLGFGEPVGFEEVDVYVKLTASRHEPDLFPMLLVQLPLPSADFYDYSGCRMVPQAHDPTTYVAAEDGCTWVEGTIDDMTLYRLSRHYLSEDDYRNPHFVFVAVRL